MDLFVSSNSGVVGADAADAREALDRLLARHTDRAADGCPLLTPLGEVYCRERLAGRPADPAPRPRWDASRRTLWLGPRRLRVFRQPAPFQTALLDAFEARGWVAALPDPLPGQPGETEADAQRRLRETVKNLNRKLPPGTIRFHGDGTGRGVWWEDCRPAAGSGSAG